ERAEIEAAPQALEGRGLTEVEGGTGLLGGGCEVHAAHDVDLVVHRRETLGVVGESGSGKSTVARCIVRLIDPTSGEVMIEGTNVADISQAALRSRRQDIQIVFQDPYRDRKSVVQGKRVDRAWRRHSTDKRIKQYT